MYKESVLNFTVEVEKKQFLTTWDIFALLSKIAQNRLFRVLIQKKINFSRNFKKMVNFFEFFDHLIDRVKFLICLTWLNLDQNGRNLRSERPLETQLVAWESRGFIETVATLNRHNTVILQSENRFLFKNSHDPRNSFFFEIVFSWIYNLLSTRKLLARKKFRMARSFEW